MSYFSSEVITCVSKGYWRKSKLHFILTLKVPNILATPVHLQEVGSDVNFVKIFFKLRLLPKGHEVTIDEENFAVHLPQFLDLQRWHPKVFCGLFSGHSTD